MNFTCATICHIKKYMKVNYEENSIFLNEITKFLTKYCNFEVRSCLPNKETKERATTSPIRGLTKLRSSCNPFRGGSYESTN